MADDIETGVRGDFVRIAEVAALHVVDSGDGHISNSIGDAGGSGGIGEGIEGE